ncbi:hypothetical protein E2C01_093543 [Portunus trituberculatus]|uniref:Uncharacterized protein n=1 Tax=Portunus trituberculatus TaxID=210409 RepID=A0A5B7JYI9_PORTR|nr:hypothetical protein [Portunus trituberculatus]
MWDPDRLAQCALQDDAVDPSTEYTLGYIKSNVKDFVHSSISDQLELCYHRGSGVLVFTMYVSPRAVLTPMRDTLHHTTG